MRAQTILATILLSLSTVHTQHLCYSVTFYTNRNCHADDGEFQTISLCGVPANVAQRIPMKGVKSVAIQSDDFIDVAFTSPKKGVDVPMTLPNDQRKWNPLPGMTYPVANDPNHKDPNNGQMPVTIDGDKYLLLTGLLDRKSNDPLPQDVNDIPRPKYCLVNKLLGGGVRLDDEAYWAWAPKTTDDAFQWTAWAYWYADAACTADKLLSRTPLDGKDGRTPNTFIPVPNVKLRSGSTAVFTNPKSVYVPRLIKTAFTSRHDIESGATFSSSNNAIIAPPLPDMPSHIDILNPVDSDGNSIQGQKTYEVVQDVLHSVGWRPDIQDNGIKLIYDCFNETTGPEDKSGGRLDRFAVFAWAP